VPNAKHAMLVVDASALAELLLDRRSGDAVAAHLARHGDDLHAPHLVDIEVLNALRRLAAAGATSAVRAGEAVTDFLALTLERYPHAILGMRIWQLRHNFSAYDATYLALAEKLADDGVPLLTSDARFARAARKHTGVEVLLAA
jgi:predicted nucleic acid-binding protein